MKFQKKPVLCKKNPNFQDDYGQPQPQRGKPGVGTRLPSIGSANGGKPPQSSDKKSGQLRKNASEI
jgi:hypothetical protein